MSTAILVESLRKEYHLTKDPKTQQRWLKEFDILYRTNQIQALLLSQTMTLQDHQAYLDYNQNDNYDEEELEQCGGISHFTMEELYQQYNLNLRHGFTNFNYPPASLQPLFNHACRMGNTKLVELYIRHNHNNWQTQLSIQIGLILATLNNHYHTIDILLRYLMDNFDQYTIQLIFLAYHQQNFHLAHRLLHRPLKFPIQNVQEHLNRAIDQNALFLVECMIKYWYLNPDIKHNLMPYGYPIDIQYTYNYAIRSNKKDIIIYLENTYPYLNQTYESIQAIAFQGSDTEKILPIIQKITQEHLPASTLTYRLKKCCFNYILPIVLTSLIFNTLLSATSFFSVSHDSDYLFLDPEIEEHYWEDFPIPNSNSSFPHLL